MYSWKPSGDKVYSHICRISVLMTVTRSLKGRTVKAQNSCTFQNFTQRSHLNSELQISHTFLPALSKSLAVKYALWPSCPLTIFQAIQSPQKHGRRNLSFVERRTTKSTTTLKEISRVGVPDTFGAETRPMSGRRKLLAIFLLLSNRPFSKFSHITKV